MKTTHSLLFASLLLTTFAPACAAPTGDGSASGTEAVTKKRCDPEVDDDCIGSTERPPPSHGGSAGGTGGGYGGAPNPPTVMSVDDETQMPSWPYALELDGYNFGIGQGQVRVYGSFPHASYVAMPILDWSDSKVRTDSIPIDGWVEQDAQVSLVSAYGLESGKTTVHIYPRIVSQIAPASLFSFAPCSPRATGSNTCGAVSATNVGAMHVQKIDSCGNYECYPGMYGTDYIALPALANGWRYVNYQFGPSQGVARGLWDGWSPGSDTMVVQVQWSTSQLVADYTSRRWPLPTTDAAMKYELFFWLEGPAGVPLQ